MRAWTGGEPGHTPATLPQQLPALRLAELYGAAHPLQKALTPAAVMRLRPRIAAIANGLADSMIPVGGMDLIADYALPLAVMVITDMLGVPATNRKQLRECRTPSRRRLISGHPWK